jgi:hypothetical protein
MVAVTPRVLGKEEKGTPALAHATEQEITTIRHSTDSTAELISNCRRKSRQGRNCRNPNLSLPTEKHKLVNEFGYAEM